VITLYGFLPSGNVYKVRLLLAQLAIPHRRVEVSQLTGDTATREFRAINSIGKVPAVRLTDGRVLTESGAILYYFARGTPFWPADPWDQTQILRWMFFEQYSHEPPIAGNRYWLAYQPSSARVGKEQIIEINRARGAHALAVMEQHLAAHSWFSGPAYGIADIALYAYTHIAEEGQFSLAGLPAVCAWLERVAAQPGHITLMQETSAEPVRTLQNEKSA
jgi:glutathione S-transferase